MTQPPRLHRRPSAPIRFFALALSTLLVSSLVACGGSDDEVVYPPRSVTFDLPRVVGGVLPVEVQDLFGLFGHDVETVLGAKVIQATQRDIFSCDLVHMAPPPGSPPTTRGGPWTLVVDAAKNIERQSDQCVVRADTTTGELTINVHGEVDTMAPRGDSVHIDGGVTGQAGQVKLDQAIRATDARPVRIFIDPDRDALPYGVSYDAATNTVAWQANVHDSFSLPVYLMDDAGNTAQVLLVVSRNMEALTPPPENGGLRG